VPNATEYDVYLSIDGGAFNYTATSGITSLNMDHDYNGDFLKCAKLNQAVLGNAKHDNFSAILKNKENRCLNLSTNYLKCNKCKFLFFCRGCPAIANNGDKKPFILDPSCWIGN